MQRIIIVSTDGGYVPYLKERREEGIEIIVIATTGRDPITGYFMLGRDLHESFTFVDLENYAAAISGQSWFPDIEDIMPL